MRNRLQGTGYRVQVLLLLLSVSLCLCGEAQARNLKGKLRSAAGVGSLILWLQDDFEGNNFTATWDTGADRFAWIDAYNFYWHAQTSVKRAGSYAAQGKFVSVNTSTFTSPHGTPTLGQTACAGAGGARYVKIVYVRPNNPTGVDEKYYSNEANLTVSASNCLTVTSPASGETFYHYMIYAGTASGDGNLKLQNSTTAIDIGTNWTEPAGGLVDLGAYPSISADGGSQTRFFNRYPNTPTGIGERVFTRMYYRIATPTSPGSKTLQRKIMRMSTSAQNGDTCVSGTCSEVTITMTDSDGTGSTVQVLNQLGGCSSLSAFTTTDKIGYDTWYSIELEVLLNPTVNVADGTVRLWFDGVQVGENTAFKIRCNDDGPVGLVQFGDQSQTSGGAEAIDDTVYIDDIKVANNYIGQ